MTGERRAWTIWLAGMALLWAALGALYYNLDRLHLSARDGRFADRGVLVVFILTLTLLAARLAAGGVRVRMRHGWGESASLYITLAQVLVCVIGLVTIFSALGIAIAPLLTTLGLGGLAVALALNDTLSNLFAGLQIVAAKQLRPGDYVKFDFGEGCVSDIHWHNTTIRDPNGNLIVIPNAKVNTTPFTNLSLDDGSRTLSVTATLPWKGTAQELLALAREAAGSKARVSVSALNEASVQVSATIPLTSPADRASVSSEFLTRLYEAARSASA